MIYESPVIAAVVLGDVKATTPNAAPSPPAVGTGAAGHVYFSPHGGCTAAIVKALEGAKATVLVQAYSFTGASIAAALRLRIGAAWPWR